jgi:hypothetical protein
MSIDVMKQALEAIEWALDFIPPESETNCECPLCTAYDALDLAIEQAERPYADKAALLNSDRLRIDPVTGNVGIGSVTQAERQEPVAWVCTCGANLYVDDAGRPCSKVAPPQRQPLTDEQVCDLWSWSATAEAERTATTQQHAFARAIERAHGIGGGG